jgi:hypothetical protein
LFIVPNRLLFEFTNVFVIQGRTQLTTKQDPLKFLESVIQNLTSESRENMHVCCSAIYFLTFVQLVSKFGLQLPLVERENLGKVIWDNIKARYNLYLNGDSNREHHKRLFCYGPPGIFMSQLFLTSWKGTGKSRTAVECINLAIGYATDPHRQSQLTEEYLLFFCLL